MEGDSLEDKAKELIYQVKQRWKKNTLKDKMSSNTKFINSYIDIRHVTSEDPQRLRVIRAPQSGRAVM